MDFQDAKVLLNMGTRMELKDHAFGDREITWYDAEGIEIATGYVSAASADVSVFGGKGMFYAEDARELSSCGEHVVTSRNDTTGPGTYIDGVMVSELTLEAVFKELTQPRLDQQNGF